MIFLANSNSKEIELPKDPTFDEFERYSREVYQQGRADQRKEDEELNYHYQTSHECYMQGRADAIDEISKAMYHEAFEVEHEKDGMQKWDSGNWIRYKLFENVLEQLKENKNE